MLSGTKGGSGAIWMTSRYCAGHEIDFELNLLLGPLWGFPLLWFGSVPLIALAWGVEILSRRAGRSRLGRILGRFAATVMIVRHLPTPLLFMFDLSADPGCVDNWGPLELTGRGIAMDFYRLIPAILMLLAVRAPRTPRGGLARTVIAVPLVIVTLLGVGADAARGKVSSVSALDCAGFGDGTVSGLDESEKGFLCQVRDDTRGISALEDMPDRELLAYGRHLCDLAVRNGGDAYAPAVSKAFGDIDGRSLVAALVRLCPKVAEVEQGKVRREREEHDAYVAAVERRCSTRLHHRPMIKPVRQVRETMWTESWELYAWDEANEGDEVDDRVADLVGSGPGALRIWAADEIGHACVTGESYRRRPPVETESWEQVVEVGYQSADGVLSIVDGDGKQLPDLAAGGPGNYRVRVHIRGRKAVTENIDTPDGAVQLLIMVFPGKVKEPRIYRDYPS
ncbi:hypothetical protein [Streptosporangium sp. NPDC002607]